MKNLSPILVAKNEDEHVVSRKSGERRELVAKLRALNVPAEVAPVLPLDVMWIVDGVSSCWDLKTTSDFIASYLDGRVYSQIKAMRDMGAEVCGFIIELDEGRTSYDGHMVGGADHGWTWDQFENAIVDLQHHGVIISRAYSPAQTPRRIVSLYNWTGKDTIGSWQSPVPVRAENDWAKGVVFYDETYRDQVGMLMHLPDCGLVKANQLRQEFSFMDVLGITEEGLIAAQQRWSSLKGIGPKNVQRWGNFLRA